MYKSARITVLIVVTMKDTVVWHVMPPDVAKIYQCFIRTYCLHLQGPTSGMMVNFYQTT
jgi:hypothetical protein